MKPKVSLTKIEIQYVTENRDSSSVTVAADPRPNIPDFRMTFRMTYIRVNHVIAS